MKTLPIVVVSCTLFCTSLYSSQSHAEGWWDSVKNMLGAVPAVATLSEGGLGGLMNKAAEYSDSLKSINDLKNQFDTLGLDTGMIMKYVSQAQQYLDTPQGQEAKTMLTDAFAKWVS